MSAKVFIVDGARTPFLRARGGSGPFSAADLAVMAGRALFGRLPCRSEDLDEVILGCAAPDPDDGNIARVVGLRLGTGFRVPAHTVLRNCASGLQALAGAYDRIRAGHAHLVLAGGTDAMTRLPVQWSWAMSGWLGRLKGARTAVEQLQSLRDFRLSHLRPVFPIAAGLRDAFTGLSVGQAAEVIAHRFGISRLEQDRYALQSHQRLVQAETNGAFDEEVEVAYESDGTFHGQDDGGRPDLSLDILARLPPLFDKPQGAVTSGNSAPLADGAALLLLASESAAKRWGLPLLGEIVHHAWAGVDPAQMGLGAVHAVANLLSGQALRLDDVAHVELHEASSAQVLACQLAFASKTFAQEELALPAPLGAVPAARLNPHGGGIAFGHSPGATGARLVLHLARTLQDQPGALGLAAMCVNGGQGGAMLVRGGAGR